MTSDNNDISPCPFCNHEPILLDEDYNYHCNCGVMCPKAVWEKRARRSPVVVTDEQILKMVESFKDAMDPECLEVEKCLRKALAVLGEGKL